MYFTAQFYSLAAFTHNGPVSDTKFAGKLNSMKQIIGLLTLLSLGVLSCRKTDNPPVANFHFYDSMAIDGYNRSYLLNLPPNYNDSTNFPLVIALHGLAGSASQMEEDYGLTARSNNAHFVIVYPEGVRSDGILHIRTWNAGTCCDFAMEHNVDDVQFISKLIQRLTANYKIDPKKIYVTGMSNGAMMTYRLACELSQQIAAIAPVSGTLLTQQPCTPARMVPVLHIHSAIDTKVPYAGGYGLANYYFPAVDSTLRVWAGINGCHATPQLITDASLYTQTQYMNCSDNATVQLFLTKDGGHSWPGGLPARQNADAPSAAFNATDLIWDFFKQYQLP
jgi:polyhydroxybutyrate depolymerase